MYRTHTYIISYLCAHCNTISKKSVDNFLFFIFKNFFEKKIYIKKIFTVMSSKGFTYSLKRPYASSTERVRAKIQQNFMRVFLKSMRTPPNRLKIQ
jgi:hypothetical protein